MVHKKTEINVATAGFMGYIIINPVSTYETNVELGQKIGKLFILIKPKININLLR
jgi:hypothetical protein